jgi:lipoprotein NlpD
MLKRMKGSLRFALLCTAALVLAACGPLNRSVVVQPAGRTAGPQRASSHGGAGIPGGSYRVVRGDTLYAIAFRNGVDFRDLAAWNGIAAPYTIWPGQRLQLASSTAAPVRAASQATNRTGRTSPPAAIASGQPAGRQVFQSATSIAGGIAANASVQTGRGTRTIAAAPVVPVAGVPDAGASVPPPALSSVGTSRTAGGVKWRWPASGVLIKRFQSGDAIPGIELAGKSGDPVRAAADGVVVYSGNGLVGYGELIIIKHNDSFLSAYGHNRKRLVKEGQRVSAGQQIAEMGSTGASRDELEFQVRLNGNPVDPLAYLPAR